jgi:hypothetical protein
MPNTSPDEMFSMRPAPVDWLLYLRMRLAEKTA